MNLAPTLTPDPATGLVTIVAGYTPTLNIHTPESIYAKFYWLPTVGPLSYLAWERMNLYLPADDTTITIGYDELAWSLGAAPGRLTRAVARLVKFHLATIDPDQPDTLRVQRKAPTLRASMLAGLAAKCPTLADAHHEQLDTFAA